MKYPVLFLHESIEEGRRLKRKVFGSIAAQQDNLGDIAIRRIFFNSFANEGHSLILLTQGMPSSYIELFEFSNEVELIRNPFRFQARLVWESLNRRADLVYAPGPHRLVDKPRALAKTVLMLGNIALVRVTGGVIQSAGRALRGDAPLARFLERQIISMSKLYAVRDSVSEAVAKRKLILAPDLAFGLNFTVRGANIDRKIIACSFRSDTKVDAKKLGQLVDGFQKNGFQVVLVSQVQRDDAQHESLADKLNIEAYLWGTKTHSEQQAVVESVYNKAHSVISNRLHGLIFGIVSGATPVEYRIGDSDKIRSTISPWFSSYPVIDNGPHADAHTVNREVQAVIRGLENFQENVQSTRSSVEQTLTAASRK